MAMIFCHSAGSVSCAWNCKKTKDSTALSSDQHHLRFIKPGACEPKGSLLLVLPTQAAERGKRRPSSWNLGSEEKARVSFGRRAVLGKHQGPMPKAALEHSRRSQVTDTAVPPASEAPQNPPTSTANEEVPPGSENGHLNEPSQSEHGTSERQTLKLFGVDLSPDTTAISSVYFVQGVLGLSRLAVSFFLKDELHLDPAETALLTGISAGPWLIKPLYGFISDGLPLFGYRRRSYLVLCGLLGAFAWGSLATLAHDKYSAVAFILLSSLSVAVSDVVVDSMVVERARGESQATAGSLQSLCWGSSATGGIVSAYFSGSLVEAYGTRFVFGITALLPLITSAVAYLVQEDRLDHSPALDMPHPVDPVRKSTALVDPRGPPQPGNGATKLAPSADQSEGAVASASWTTHGSEDGAMASSGGWAELTESARSQMVYLWDTIKQPSILLPTLFIFVWQATPQSDTAMFYFTTNVLDFGPEFLGRVRLVTSVASLVGVGVYNAFLKQVPLRKMFLWTTILGTAVSSTQLLLVTGVNRTLGISDQYFAIGDSLVLTVLGQVSFMPILVLAARLCPPGVEATLFATLMSISNGAGVTGGLLGASLTGALGVTSVEFDNLALLLVLCNASSLLPLFFLGLLPSEKEMNEAVAEAQEKIEARKDE